MASDLIFLVIDRAPVNGIAFRVLLYVAIQANCNDCCYAPYSHIAASMRMSRGRAQRGVQALVEANLISRVEPGKNAFVVHRDRLWRHPVHRSKQQARFQGVTNGTWNRQIAACIQDRVNQAISKVLRVQQAAADARTGLLRGLLQPD
jgi:hypothetical protein